MKKVLAIILIILILTNLAAAETGAQTDQDSQEDEDCNTCRNTGFYYVLIAGLVVFAFFFYVRNRDKFE